MRVVAKTSSNIRDVYDRHRDRLPGAVLVTGLAILLVAVALSGSAMGEERSSFVRRARHKLEPAAYKLAHALGPVLARFFRPTKVSVSRHQRKWTGPHLRAVVFSDVHVNRATGDRPLEQIAAHLRREKPDLVLIPGDFGEPFASREENYTRLARFGEMLTAAVAPHGRIVATLGNHDHYVDHDREAVTTVRDALGSVGVTVLSNEHRSIELSGGRMVEVVGVDDGSVGQADVARAVIGLEDPSRALALTHFPNTAAEIADHGLPFIFAGHTHGGKLHLPLLTALARRLVGSGRYVRGWYDVRATARTRDRNADRHSEVYVSPGIGDDEFLQHWRIGKGAQPEIAVIDFSTR